MRIAISATEFIGWGGGIDLIRLITNALISVAGKNKWEVEIIIQIPTLKTRFLYVIDFYKNLLHKIIRRKPIECFFPEKNPVDKHRIKKTLKEINGKINIIYFKKNLNRFLVDNRFNLILPILNSNKKEFPIPWIGYIYDLQHKYYPGFFSKEEYQSRDELFAYTLMHARSVIVNSLEVQKDIKKFIPQYKSRIFSLPCAPYPLPSWLKEKRSLLKKYSLPQKYFLISSQFWIHKDHLTAFKAIKFLTDKACCADVKLVCTGNTADYRFPDYFDKLKQFIKTNDLEDKIHILGHIPKSDQMEIMKNSIGVIQTTLFEGGPGGGATYDAIAIGKPCIISDIPINKEIHENDVTFFRTKDEKDLALKMLDLLNKKPILPSTTTLIRKGMERTEKLAIALEEAINYTLNAD